MFQPNNLAKLYPHLQFNRLPTQTRSLSEPPRKQLEEPPVLIHLKPTEVTEKVIEKEIVVETPNEIIEEPIEIKPPKPKAKRREVKIQDPIKQEDQVVITPSLEKKDPKPKITPKRSSQIPVKGERGLQKKYTVDQRKEMYMNRLAKKSLKNAEKEVSEVTAVLDSVGHDPVKLVEREKEIKRSLKLINYAKYFSNSTNIEKVDEELEDNQSQEPSGSDLSDASE